MLRLRRTIITCVGTRRVRRQLPADLFPTPSVAEISAWTGGRTGNLLPRSISRYALRKPAHDVLTAGRSRIPRAFRCRIDPPLILYLFCARIIWPSRVLSRTIVEQTTEVNTRVLSCDMIKLTLRAVLLSIAVDARQLLHHTSENLSDVKKFDDKRRID